MNYVFAPSCPLPSGWLIVLHSHVIKTLGARGWFQAVAALFGAGSDWDLGISDEEHAERRASSRRLRESLSTFQDVNFAEGNGSGGGREGGVPALDLGNHGSDEEGEGRDKGGAPPPNLKRTK